MKTIDPSCPEVVGGFKLLNGARIRFPASPLEVKLYYSRHGNEHELDESFSSDLQQSDLFCFESIGWEKWQLELTQRVADGDKAAAEEVESYINSSRYPSQANFAKRMYRTLFASNVRVHFPDVPKNHPYLTRYFQAIKRIAPVAARIESGDDICISDNQLHEMSTSLMTATVKRDRHVLEHFFPKELEPRPLIRIVGFFGLLHSGTAISLARAAAKQGRNDIAVSANTSHESDTLFKFLNGQPISTIEHKDLIRYWLESSI